MNGNETLVKFDFGCDCTYMSRVIVPYSAK